MDMAAPADASFADLYPYLLDTMNEDRPINTSVSNLAAYVTKQDGDPERLWDLIVRTAARNQQSHTRLVEVLVLLSQLPGTRIAKRHGFPSREVVPMWTGLPMLGWKLDYEWNYPDATYEHDTPIDPSMDVEETNGYFLNINRFTALLMVTGNGIFDYDLFCLWEFRAALELPESQVVKWEYLDVHVLAAAAWIEILGGKIFKWDKIFESGPNKGDPGGGGPLWKGESGFCPARWRLWRERFAACASLEQLPMMTRHKARAASVEMAEIESSRS